MPDGKLRRRLPQPKTYTEDGIEQPKPGEIARLLHIDMAAHRKKTQDFNDGWKRALCLASVGLALVSLLKAVEKAREGDSGWMERALTSANAGLIAGWVTQVDGQAETSSLFPSQMAAFGVSLYQLVVWWISRQEGVHVDFPVSVILIAVVVASIASMRSTRKEAENAFQASGALAEKVSVSRSR